MAENWYIVLELEFDPNPVEDQATIEKRIDEKAKFWSSKFNDFKKGAEYRKYHQMIPEIKRVMNEDAERKRLIKEACDITYGPIDKILKVIGRKGEITEDEVDKIVTQQKVQVEQVKKRAEKLGIKIVVPEIDYKALYNKYYSAKPQDAAKFDGMKPLLDSFDVGNLYDFLYANTPMKNAYNLPPETLRQRAIERKKNEFFKNDSVSGNGSKLCGHCELAFKDESSKNIYDEYLKFCKRKAVLDEVKNIAIISGELSAQQADMFIGQLTELFKDRKLSNDVLVAFCKAEKIAYISQETPGKSLDNIKVCRCGTINDVSDGRKVCQNCGMELIIKCPQCGTECDANIKVCKCKFEFEKIDKAIALCDLAEHAIETMDFNVAEAHLIDAGKIWPGSSKVSALLDHLKDVKQRVGSVAESMRKSVAEKRYIEGRKQYANIQKYFPEFREIEVEEEISAAIDTAQTLLNKAQASNNEKEIIEHCSKAYEVCKDYPGIKELISQYPPQMPGNINVSADGNTRTNIISWDKSPSGGSVFYSVVRKKDAIPVNTGDGDLLGRINTCSFNDNRILPGVNYYYAIFAERAGAFSSPLTIINPVVNLFEIANAAITVGDAFAQIDWDKVPAGTTVEIFRSVGGGKEERININNAVNFLDSDLINDQVYNYKLRLVYNVNGQKFNTSGVVLSGIPTKPPQAIDSLRITPVQDDTYQVIWDNPENENVELYCSNLRPEYKCGDMLPQSVLESKMKRLAVTKTSNSSGTFQYKGTDLLYVTPVIIKSGSAVFGAIARASKEQMLVIKRIAAVNDKINIYIDLPKGATGFVVLYRFDQFPLDISDIKTVRKYIPLKQYQYNNALVLDSLEPKNYYFSVFAEFARDGEKDYSPGADYLFRNAAKEVITYSINISKKLFGGSNVVMEFEAENKSFILPDIEIFSSIGNVPMYKASAALIFSIPSQPVNGSIKVSIPLPRGIEKDTYIKAFLKDETMQSYQLKLKVKSSYKIN